MIVSLFLLWSCLECLCELPHGTTISGHETLDIVSLFCITIKVVTGTTEMVPYSHLSFTPPALQESNNQYQSSAQ